MGGTDSPFRGSRPAVGFLPAVAGGLLFGFSSSANGSGGALILSFALLGWALSTPGVRRDGPLWTCWGLAAYSTALAWAFRFGAAPWMGLTLWHILFLVPAAMAGRVAFRRGATAGCIACAAAFALGEWLREQGTLGVGMVIAAGPLARSSSAVGWVCVAGATGLGFAAVLAGLLLGAGLRGRDGRALLACAALLVMLPAGRWAASVSAMRPEGTIRAAALQGITADGFKPPMPDGEMLSTYLRLSVDAAADGARLIVWPETSCPGVPGRQTWIQDTLRELFRRTGAAGLVGAVSAEESPESFRNAVLGFGADGSPADVYEKQRLTPFGEYVPARSLLPSLSRWGVLDHDYLPGRPHPPIRVAGARVGALICSESMFSGMAARRVDEGADLLVIVSNDSWFGRGCGTEQLARLAILRAAECGRSVVRASETGYSMLIAPDGRVLAQSRLYRRGATVANVPLCAGRTPYVRTRLLWPVALTVLLAGALAISRGRLNPD